MTTKEYLEIATDIDKRIASLTNRILYLRSRTERITPVYGICTSASVSSGDELSQAIGDMVDSAAEIVQIRNEFAKYRTRVECEIQRIPNNIYATLLEEKYINGASWETVTEKIGYSDVKHVREVLHSRALSEFEKITPENTRFVPSVLLENGV